MRISTSAMLVSLKVRLRVIACFFFCIFVFHVSLFGLVCVACKGGFTFINGRTRPTLANKRLNKILNKCRPNIPHPSSTSQDRILNPVMGYNSKRTQPISLIFIVLVMHKFAKCLRDLRLMI